MAGTFRLTLAQLNPTVGDFAANAAKARAAWEEGKAVRADMVALTEMFITGYQTQDLVMKPAFADEAMAWIEVEPGVTFRQVHDFLARRGSWLFASVTGSSPGSTTTVAGVQEIGLTEGTMPTFQPARSSSPGSYRPLAFAS